MIRRVSELWSASSLIERILVALVSALVIALVVVFAAQLGTASELRGDLAATRERIEDIESENERLASDLDAARKDLVIAEQQVEALESELARQTARATTAEEMLDEVEDAASGEVERLEASLREAQADQEEAEELVAELLLTYSEDIERARSTVASAATVFACDWGELQATEGQSIDAVTGRSALDAFSRSDDFQQLQDDAEIATFFDVGSPGTELEFAL